MITCTAAAKGMLVSVVFTSPIKKLLDRPDEDPPRHGRRSHSLKGALCERCGLTPACSGLAALAAYCRR